MLDDERGPEEAMGRDRDRSINTSRPLLPRGEAFALRFDLRLVFSGSVFTTHGPAHYVIPLAEAAVRASDYWQFHLERTPSIDGQWRKTPSTTASEMAQRSTPLMSPALSAGIKAG